MILIREWWAGVVKCFPKRILEFPFGHRTIGMPHAAFAIFSLGLAPSLWLKEGFDIELLPLNQETGEVFSSSYRPPRCLERNFSAAP
jgi:hypothetical protein